MRVIVNPAAAGGRVGRQWPQILRRLERLGLEASYVFTEAPWHAADLAAEAVAEGETLVVAAGGDGTACEIAEGLYRGAGAKGIGPTGDGPAAQAGRQPTLGLLPIGTGNDVARAAGVPTDLDAAVAALKGKGRRQLDLIKVGPRIVINAIGLGLIADINRRTVPLKVVRGITAYLITATASLIHYRCPTVHVKAPGFEYTGGITVIAIQNGPTTGGGFQLTPRGIPDDGQLDACVVEAMGPLRRVPRLLAGLNGSLGRLKGSHELRAPWLELRHDEPLAVHLDGNQDELPPPVTRFEVLAGALTIAIPEPASEG